MTAQEAKRCKLMIYNTLQILWRGERKVEGTLDDLIIHASDLSAICETLEQYFESYIDEK